MITIQTNKGTYLLSTPLNLEGLEEREILQEKYARNEFSNAPDFSPIMPPNWDGLLNRLLSGDLFPLFQTITLAAFSNPVLLMARNDIYGAISNPKISDRISALRAGLAMLLQSGYQISDSDRALWNQAIAELNFPDEVKL